MYDAILVAIDVLTHVPYRQQKTNKCFCRESAVCDVAEEEDGQFA